MTILGALIALTGFIALGIGILIYAEEKHSGRNFKFPSKHE